MKNDVVPIGLINQIGHRNVLTGESKIYRKSQPSSHPNTSSKSSRMEEDIEIFSNYLYPAPHFEKSDEKRNGLQTSRKTEKLNLVKSASNRAITAIVQNWQNQEPLKDGLTHRRRPDARPTKSPLSTAEHATCQLKYNDPSVLFLKYRVENG